MHQGSTLFAIRTGIRSIVLTMRLVGMIPGKLMNPTLLQSVAATLQWPPKLLLDKHGSTIFLQLQT
jgi:hypothetical protein